MPGCELHGPMINGCMFLRCTIVVQRGFAAICSSQASHHVLYVGIEEYILEIFDSVCGVQDRNAMETGSRQSKREL